jgi:ATP-dependent Clp protease ATP-binding subunit ClpB
VIDARNCIVVMTSNLGAEYLQRPNAANGKIDDTTRQLVERALQDYFLPEFYNRINKIVIFNRLTKAEIRKIVDIRLVEIQKRLEANGKCITIDCSPAVRDYLGTAGYSPVYGARPLSRLIEREVLNRLAVLLLRGSVQDGEVAKVVMEDNRITVLPNHEEDSEQTSSEDEMELDDVADALGGDDMELALYE